MNTQIMIRKYRRGMPMTAIADEAGLSYPAIRERLERAGVKFRKRGPAGNQKRRERAVRLYKKLGNTKAVAERMNCTRQNVEYLLKRAKEQKEL